MVSESHWCCHLARSPGQVALRQVALLCCFLVLVRSPRTQVALTASESLGLALRQIARHCCFVVLMRSQTQVALTVSESLVSKRLSHKAANPRDCCLVALTRSPRPVDLHCCLLELANPRDCCLLALTRPPSPVDLHCCLVALVRPLRQVALRQVALHCCCLALMRSPSQVALSFEPLPRWHHSTEALQLY